MLLRISVLVLLICFNAVVNGVLVCYWGSWSTYRTGIANFEVDDIDTTLCTHVVYAYTGLINGVIASLDEYNDYEANYGKGNMNKFTRYIQLNEIHGLVGIGGWNEGSTKYSQMASTEAGRTAFADSVVAYCQRFGFEGLAFDWMYPTQRGGAATDKENYVLLLQTLKEKLSANGLTLFAGVGAAENVATAAYDFVNVANSVDQLIVWTYDYHSYADGVTAVSAPLKAADNKSVENSINLWLDAGVPANKLVLSIAAYGHTSHLADASKHGIGDTVTGPGTAGQYSQEPGVLTYFEYCSNLNWVPVHSDDSSYVYAYHDNQWINYDDEDTILAKGAFAQEKGLGGFMMYSMESDDFKGSCGGAYPLLIAVNDAFFKK